MPVPARSSASPIDSAASRPLSRNHETSGVPATRTIRCGGGTGRPSAGAGGGACDSRAARTRSYVRYVGARRRVRPSNRRSAFFAATRTERTLAPMAQAPALPRGFELPLEPRLPQDRLRRSGRRRGPRGRAREALDQARGEAVRARSRDSLHGSHDARRLRHAGQGRGALLEGGASGSDRSRHPVGRRRVRLSEPRAGRRRAPARQRRQGRLGRDRVPVRAVAPCDEARGGALGRGAGRGRGRHGDRPRRVPLRTVREGLRRDRARQGGVRRRAPEGDPRDRRARHLRQRAPREPAGDGRRRRLHQDVDGEAPERRDAAGRARDARGDPRRARGDRAHRRLQARRRDPQREAGGAAPRARARDARHRLADARPLPARRVVAPERRADADPQGTHGRVSKPATSSPSTDGRDRTPQERRAGADELGLRARARVARRRLDPRGATATSSAASGSSRRRRTRRSRPPRRSRSRRSGRRPRRKSTSPSAPRARRSRTAGRRCRARSARSTSSGSRASSRSARGSSRCSSR